MASLEKLQKSLECLKSLVKADQHSDSRKKEKIQLCHTITEAMSNPTIKVSPSFHVILGVTIQTFLQLCDDSESDVRMIADECLNRVIRITCEGHIGQILVELHKEIKKNASPRSLRAALIRFSQLAHLIRPQKGRAYVSNLFPSIIKICERTEEPLYESLAIGFPRIIEVLGCFAAESEIKILLKAFFKKVTNQSPAIRRSSSTCILNICLNSKRQYFYIGYCIDNLLDLLQPLDENIPESAILGVLGCLKILLPYLNETKESKIQPFSTQKLLQIYEFCVIFLKNTDHNVVIMSFETLNVLLTNANKELKKALLNPSGLEKSRITRVNYLMMDRVKSPSQLSVATTLTANEDSLFPDTELTDTVETDIVKWINESQLTMLNAQITAKSLSVDTLTDSFDRVTEVTDFSVTHPTTTETLTIGERNGGSPQNAEKTSENSSEKSYSVAGTDSEAIQGIEIGDFLDKSPPLLYCIRLIVKSFLLTGVPKKYVSDKTVRVSVKSSAIGCLASIFRLYPSGFYKFLDKNAKTYSFKKKNYPKYLYSDPETSSSDSENISVSAQFISDITLFSEHPDPQLRGGIITLVADLVVAILRKSHYNIDSWLDRTTEMTGNEFSNSSLYLEIWIQGLKDESSVCLKQTLTSLHPLINMLANSSWSNHNMLIFEPLLLLVKNPYWLLKVSLCELLSKLCYTSLYHIAEKDVLQKLVVFNVLFELLKDGDHRIRTAAANGLVEIVPNLYYQPKILPVAFEARKHCEKYLEGLNDTELEYNVNKKHFIRNMPFPFCEVTKKGCYRTEFNLSIIISELYLNVMETSSKHFVAGCIETLSLLSTRYPPTVYKNAWNNCMSKNSEPETLKYNIPDLLSLCITLLTNSSHVFDVQFQINVLHLAGNLYAGYSVLTLLPVQNLEEEPHLWKMFSSQPFRNLSEAFLSFLMKLLHIFHTVVNDLVPVVPQSKIGLSNLTAPGTVSPLKRQKSNVEKKSPILGKDHEKQEKIDKKEEKNMELGNFVGLKHYMKIYEVLKSSFINYKISLDPHASGKFIELMQALLHCLSVLLEVASLSEFGRISEELLLYLKSTFTLNSVPTVQCVQQLLKCLFGTNLAFNMSDILEESDTGAEKPPDFDIYNTVVKEPYEKITAAIKLVKNDGKAEFEGDYIVMGFPRRKDIKIPSVLTRVTSDRALAGYIRIFEPIVIKSLKHYTMTSNVQLQAQVLQLLTQLVQLRVNYCLLDSDQVFKDFVLRQFEFIEEGQIRHSEELVSKIFQFLVYLSYSKQHSKSIMEIPKIIQLCDGLMASGQCPLTHCIPSLEPIIEDVFLVRNKTNTTDLKELETTRDVIFSMLLRLFEYKEVINLVTLILEDCKYCKDSLEKWQRWSSQVFTVFLSLLKQNKIKTDNTDAFKSLKKFVNSLHPDILTSADEMIVMLFQDPPQEEDTATLKRWLSKILILFLILLPLKEDDFLKKIDRLKASFSPGCINGKITPAADPLNVRNNADIFKEIPHRKILVLTIFRIISLVSSRICTLEENDESDQFLVGMYSSFLECCIYIFKAGNHTKPTRTAKRLIKAQPGAATSVINICEIHSASEHMTKLYPTVTLQWLQILALLDFDASKFWTEIVQSIELTDCIVLLGRFVILCDAMKNSPPESHLFSWYINNISLEIVESSDEPQVFEYIRFVFEGNYSRKIFLRRLLGHFYRINEPVMIFKLLKILDLCHPSQIVTVLERLLNHRMLGHKHIAVARAVSTFATQKLELLLTLEPDEVRNDLSDNIIRDMMDGLFYNMDRKFETLGSLLRKIAENVCDWEHIETRMTLEDIQVPCDIKQTFLQIIRWTNTKHCDLRLKKQLATALSDLERHEILPIISSQFKADDEFPGYDSCGVLRRKPVMNLQDFGKSLLGQCIELGTKFYDKSTEDDGQIQKSPIFKVLFKEFEILIHKAQFSSMLRSAYLYDEKFKLQEANLTSALISLMNRPDEMKHFNSNQFNQLFKVTAIFAEYFRHTCEDLNVSKIETHLECLEKVLSRPEFTSLFATDENVEWLCLFVNTVHSSIVEIEPREVIFPSADTHMLKMVKENGVAGQACSQLHDLMYWLYKIETFEGTTYLPHFLFKRYRKLVVLLCRLPQFYSYIIVPLKVWGIGWQPEMSGEFLTEVPTLPVEYLQEIDVLDEYIFRVTLLGWTSRQKFEETWMSFLSVLCYPLDTVESLDVTNSIKASSHAVKAITSLLMQTIRDPILGNNVMSKLMHVSRSKSVCEESISIKKLKLIQSRIRKELKSHSCIDVGLKDVFEERNFEKISEKYTYGQLSIKYFMVATNSHIWDGCTACEMYKKWKKMLEDSGIDVDSCLRFLLDYFTQQIKTESSIKDLGLLHEIVKSIVTISDLFSERSQFEWMLNLFLDLLKLHSYEDELLHQYLIVGLCKAVAVISPELEIFEQVKNVLIQFVKSPFVCSRIACLYGILYLLEGCLLNTTEAGGISEKTQLLLPLAVEYVQLHLDTSNNVLKRSQEHSLLVWSLAFFLIENIDQADMETTFIDSTLSTAFEVLKSGTGDSVEKCIFKGLERLLLVRPKYALGKIGKQLCSLALENLNKENTVAFLMGFQLFLTYMYIDCAEQLEKDRQTPTNPDQLVQTMEKTTAIFEAVKKGYTMEAEVICTVLPAILNDFFSPSDILTKVIGEFLSTQQPYPKLMSGVVFEVFENAIAQDQLSLLQDWVVFSLPNFTQSFTNMTVWNLTVFFISASTNRWLRPIFPHLQTRMGRYEHEDKTLFGMAGLDFYKNLTEQQKERVVSSFENAKDQPDTLFEVFANLLKSV